MNIASDGDEASPAAETGETARTLTIALITKMGKVSAGLQLNGATFRLNLLRCSLELLGGHCHIGRFYWSVLTPWQRSVSIKSRISEPVEDGLRALTC